MAVKHICMICGNKGKLASGKQCPLCKLQHNTQRMTSFDDMKDRIGDSPNDYIRTDPLSFKGCDLFEETEIDVLASTLRDANRRIISVSARVAEQRAAFLRISQNLSKHPETRDIAQFIEKAYSKMRSGWVNIERAQEMVSRRLREAGLKEAQTEVVEDVELKKNSLRELTSSSNFADRIFEGKESCTKNTKHTMNSWQIGQHNKKQWGDVMEGGPEAEYSKCSTQIDVSEEISEIAKSIQKKIDQSVIHREFPLSEDGSQDPKETKGLESQHHVTVLYGLTKDEDVEVAKGLCAKQEPFEVEFGEIGSFRTNDEFDVLWVKAISPELNALNGMLRKNCAYENSYNDYHPHLTLGYVQKGACKDLEGECELTGKKCMIDKVTWSDRGGGTIPLSFKV